MTDASADLESVLTEDERLTSDGELLKNRVVELALQSDEELVSLLLSEDEITERFFEEVSGTLIFDRDSFVNFVSNEEFLPDSYTRFTNRVGLTAGDEYYRENGDVELAWPYRDCVLEGDQTETGEARDEIFWNETLAPEEVDRLLHPKVLTGFEKHGEEGDVQPSDLSTDHNLFVRGNNLIALHSLKERVRGEVKLVYIDPPYNTGSDGFRYNDSFNHSSWLTFMKNRIEVARDLLRDDGAMFVQIDNHEQPYLEVLCNEIFGRENFVNKITVETRAPSGFKLVNPGVFSTAEYVLLYARDRSEWEYRPQYVAAEYDRNYNKVIPNRESKPEAWNIQSLRDYVATEELGFSSQSEARSQLDTAGFDYQVAEFARKNAERVFRHAAIDDQGAGAETVEAKEESLGTEEVVVVEREDHPDRYVHDGKEIVFYANKVRDVGGETVPTKPLTDVWTDVAWEGIANEGGVTLKKGKKPEALLERIISMSSEEGDLVLDFFSGSGTTPAVAHKMNRRYVAVEQLAYGDDGTVARLDNVIAGDDSGVSDEVGWDGGGEFVSCELMAWNAEFVDEIERASTTDDLLGVWDRMKERAFLSHRLDVSSVDENADSFSDLSLDDQRRFLVEVLDTNQLYVNYSEIEDADYEVDGDLRELNRAFYGDS